MPRYLLVNVKSLPSCEPRLAGPFRTPEAEEEYIARLLPSLSLDVDQIFTVESVENPFVVREVSFQRLAEALDRAMVRVGERRDPEEERLESLGERLPA